RIVATTGFHVLNIAEELILAFMIASTGILLLRTLCVLVLALRHKRTDFPPQEPDGAAAPVSVLITAYNEAKVIRSTLGALLKSDYPGQLEILVVDDGSKDDTAQFIEEIAARDSRVRLIRQENCGKAVALSTALRESAHEFIVMLDADTVFAPGTISHLIRQLSQQNTGAVSGQAKVGNQDSLLGRFQSLEYVCGFNLDRRAYDVWNCISVVPGAVCAMRRTAIIRAGGIPRDTLAEDTDLTLSMHRLGYDVHYASHAVAWTEAPETVRALVRQRTRWAFGTMQCLWKHRDLLFNPAFGAIAFFSLPSMWFCHLFLVALIPLVDLLLVVSLATGMGMAIIDYALVFLVLDLSSAFCACLMEREKLLSAMRIIPMRLLYRPILSFAVWSAIFRAMRGAWVGWGRQERKGLVLPHWLEIQSTGL
ncbi:MAG TPA: glycosyltransferase family 2 protein, partial [Oligoflexia bacterium]|nr:glycosyltransferase family 2 protein [Oligoflexia bacterium]